MRLFDKRDKKGRKSGGDDFDSPVEQIDLSTAQTPPPTPPRRAEPEPAKAPAAANAPAAAKAPAAASPPPAPAAKPRRPEPEPARQGAEPDYGIDKAIALMRTLPADNVELVVQVVKHTLESTNIKIGQIIEDADRKQNDIQARIKVLREEIAEFEGEIATRLGEIEALDADYQETTTVRERLEQADGKGESGAGKSDGAAGSNDKPAGDKATAPAAKSESADASRSGGPSGARKPAAPASKPGSAQKTTVVAKK